MNNDESGWDNLADEFGLETTKPAPPPERPAAPKPVARPILRKPDPEPVDDAGDFGSGFDDESTPRAALYDPGPDVVAEDNDEVGEAPEPLEDPDEENGDEPTTEGGEPGPKKKRRRRRRKKKAGAPEVAGEPTMAAEAGVPVEVEGEGDEPAAESDSESDDEFEDDDSVESGEDLEAEAPGPRPEWHVMTWMDVVSKLHRPG